MTESDESPDRLERLGGFEIISKIAEGGMGAVYRAKQVSLDRTVAVKILPKRLAKNKQFVGRFLREAKLAAQFSHPNIVGAVDAGKAEGVHYFAMEYVEGESLGQMLSREKVLPEAKAVEIIIQMARALECAHKHGMVHRDVKPDNILIDEEGTAKLADLGLARQVEDEGTQLTQAGTAMGSPHYISPEQARGEGDIDIRADIYSLGATFYQLVTGRTAFSGQTVAVIMTKHLSEAPPPVREVRPEVSEATASVIAKMMAKDRSERYQTPAELLADLERLSRGEEPDAHGTEATFLMDVGDLPPVRKGVARSLVLTALVATVALALLGTAGVVIVLSRGAGAEREEFARLFEEGKALFEAGKHGRAKGVLESALALAGEGEETESAKDLLRQVELALEERDARLKAAADELAAVEGLIAEGKLDEAIDRARAGAEKFPESKDAFEALASRAEKQKLYEELVRRAREALELRDLATATALLTRAKAIRDTDEVKELLAEVRRLQYIARAEEEQRAGRLEKAIDFYGRARALRDDAELRGRVAELERRVALAKKVAEGDAFAGRGAWKSARASYRTALETARGDERPPIEKKLASVGTEIAYLELIMQARADVTASKWQAVLDGATKASEMKPDEAEPKELVLRARKVLAREKPVVNSLGMTLVYLRGGDFIQGSNSGDSDERPPHAVRLSPFYMSKTEVTNAQYERFRPDHSSQREFSEGDDCPVVRVSWRDAVDFCKWLEGQEGADYVRACRHRWFNGQGSKK